MSANPPTKVLGRRYLAYLIDALIRVAAVVVPFVLLADRITVNALAARDPSFNSDNVEQYSSFASQGLRAFRFDDRVYLFERKELVIIAAIAVGVTLLNEVLIQGRAGWTIGKGLCGLRTVNKAGDRPGIFRALIRTILLVIDLIPSYLVPLVGGLFIFASDTNRRLGDLVAGTFVVDKESWGQDPTGEDAVDTTAWTSVEDHPGHVTRLAPDEPLKVGEAAPVAAAGTAAAATEQEPSAPAEGEGEKAPTYQPQWDPARKAYLQWDPRRKTWLQFDEASGEWRPIG